MNEAWGTIVWNQTYTNWKEIYVPRTTVHDSTNPHQVLDYYRFISDSTIRFCKMQSDIIRKYKKPEDFITALTDLQKACGVTDLKMLPIFMKEHINKSFLVITTPM